MGNVKSNGKPGGEPSFSFCPTSKELTRFRFFGNYTIIRGSLPFLSVNVIKFVKHVLLHFTVEKISVCCFPLLALQTSLICCLVNKTS